MTNSFSEQFMRKAFGRLMSRSEKMPCEKSDHHHNIIVYIIFVHIHLLSDRGQQVGAPDCALGCHLSVSLDIGHLCPCHCHTIGELKFVGMYVMQLWRGS
jgi:hypothetical protein